MERNVTRHLKVPWCRESHKRWLKPCTSELPPPRLVWFNRIGWCAAAWISLIPLIHLEHLRLWRKDCCYLPLVIPSFRPVAKEKLHITSKTSYAFSQSLSGLYSAALIICFGRLCSCISLHCVTFYLLVCLFLKSFFFCLLLLSDLLPKIRLFIWTAN